MDKKRILIFISSYYPMVGGAEVAIREITKRLEGKYEFDLITAKLDRGWPKYEQIENVHVHRVGFGGRVLSKLLSPFLGALKIAELQKKHRYAAYWPMMITYTCGAPFIANFFSQNKVPIVLMLQEGDSEEYLTNKWFGMLNLSWKMALRRTSHLAVISSYLEERARRLGYVGEISIVRNGVDFDHFKPTSVTWNEETVRLITTSRLVEKNAVDVVIRSLPHLPERVVFDVLGTGPLEKDLRNLVEREGLQFRVNFAGFVEHKDMPAHFAKAHIFVRPSRSEGLGVSFMEAMAAELPVIATPVGGIPDFLEDGETGLFAAVDDPKSVSQAVMRLIENEEERNEIIRNAKDLMRREYDWDPIALQMSDIFSKVEQ